MELRGRLLRGAVLAMAALALAAVPAWRYLTDRQALSAARDALARGQEERAVEMLRQFADRAPQNAEAAYLLSSAYRRARKFTAARESLRRAVELGYSRKDARLQELFIEFESGQVKTTEEVLLQRLADGCSDAIAAEIYDCLVNGYLADLRLDSAGLTLDFWIEWQPSAIRPRLLRAQLFGMVQNHEREEQEYREVLVLDPDNFDARNRMGYILLEAKDVAAAAEMFRSCSQSRPDDLSLLVPLAACERRNGRSEEAKSMLRRALAEKLEGRRRAYALGELAQILTEEKAYDEALALLDEAIQLAPSERSAHYARGLVLSRLGKKEEAELALEKSRHIEDLNVRMQELAKDVVHRPEDANLRSEVGEIELELGDRPEALAWLLSALRCDKWHERTHGALARYYAVERRPEMVERHLAWAAESRRRAEKSQFLSPLPASPVVPKADAASP